MAEHGSLVVPGWHRDILGKPVFAGVARQALARGDNTAWGPGDDSRVDCSYTSRLAEVIRYYLMAGKIGFNIPDVYLSKYLGYRTEVVEPGITRVDFEIQPQHLNMAGVLHGGIYMTIMDSLMGHALYSISHQGLGSFFTTAMHTHFMQGVRKGSIIGHGRHIATNDDYMNAEAHITDGSGKLLASASGQFTLIDVEQQADKS